MPAKPVPGVFDCASSFARAVALVLCLGVTVLPGATLAAGAPATTAPPPGPAGAYSPKDDPARPVFEVALDLIQGINWGDRPVSAAQAFVQDMQARFPDSPYPLIAEADLSYLLWRAQRNIPSSEIDRLIQLSFAKSRQIPDAYVVLAKLSLDYNNLTRAREQVRQARLLAPVKPEVLFVTARLAEKLKRFEDAEVHYRQYLQQSAKPVRRSNIFIALANLYQAWEPPDFAKAERAYLDAILLDPTNYSKRVSYAQFLFTRHGDYEGALKVAREGRKEGGFTVLQAQALYAKWADFKDYRGAHYRPPADGVATPKPASLADLRKISEASGVPAEEIFVALSRYPALNYATQAMHRAGVVRNIDVKTEGPCGCTALVKAAEGDNLELANYLLTNRANINGTNAGGETALSYFLIRGNEAAARQLIEKGARVNYTDSDGYTPLHLAWKYARKPELIKFLLDRKADVVVPMPNGETVLAAAVRESQARYVRLFVQYGADPEQGLSSQSPKLGLLEGNLMLVSRDTILALLQAGADPDRIPKHTRDWVGRTRPDIAAVLADPQYRPVSAAAAAPAR